MKKLLALSCLVGFCLSGQRAQAIHATFIYTDAGGNPETNRTLYLYPIGNPRTNGAGGIIARDRLKGYTDVNGSVTISNIFGADYRGEFDGTYTKTTNWFSFPLTNGLVFAADYATVPTNGPSGILAYSQSHADLVFWKKAGLQPGTNTSFRTNATGVYVDTAATSGGQATNAVDVAVVAGETNLVVTTNGFLRTLSVSKLVGTNQFITTSNALRTLSTNAFVQKAGDTITGDFTFHAGGQDHTHISAFGAADFMDGTIILSGDGLVEANDFFGGASMLVGMLPENLQVGTAPINITGNAATATILSTNATQRIVATPGASNYWMTVGNTKSNSFWFNTNGSLQGIKWSLNYDGVIQWANGASSLNADGSITAPLNASSLSSGTVPDGRFPATLPAASGANLTALPAGQLTGVASSNNIPGLSATNLVGGTLADARLSGNVPLLNTNNVFTKTNTVAGLTITTPGKEPAEVMVGYKQGVGLVTNAIPSGGGGSSVTYSNGVGIPELTVSDFVGVGLGGMAGHSTDVVYVRLVFVPYSCIVSNICHGTGGSGTEHYGISLYSSDGNTRVIDSGVLTAPNGSAQVSTKFAPVTLTQGFYYVAMNQATAFNMECNGTMNGFMLGSFHRTLPPFGTAANSASGGQNPATLGAITEAGNFVWPMIQFSF